MNNKNKQVMLVRALLVCLLLAGVLFWGSAASAQNNTIFGLNVYVSLLSGKVA